MKLKVTFVLNNIGWESIAEKMLSIVDFFSPVFELEVTLHLSNFSGIPFVPVSVIGGISNTLGSTMTVDPNWYAENISIITPDADIILFCLPDSEVSAHRTSIAIMQGKVGNVLQCCVFGIKENDHAYVGGIDQGNSFVLFACHEISHALYLLQERPDNTHAYFYSGKPFLVIPELQEGRISGLYKLLAYLKQLFMVEKQYITLIESESPQEESLPMEKPKYLWDTKDNTKHSIRVLCDELGLSLKDKNIITACIQQESNFDNTAVNHNKNEKGEITSSDWGICQINDYYQIGKGLSFSSVFDVVDHPEKAVRFMIGMFKAGKLNLWSSYSSGAYKKYLP